MPYVYSDAARLAGKPVEGDRQCVWLVRHYAGAGHTSTWREGESVKGRITLPVGTAIATFIDGRYPSRAHGNHAALYLSQDACGIWVVDQWKHKDVTTIRRRLLRFADACDKKRRDYVDIGDHYAVIE